MEKHSSNDCLIIDNMPVGLDKITLEKWEWTFFLKLLTYQSNPSNFEAFQFLGKYDECKKKPPSLFIVVKRLKSTVENVGSLVQLFRTYEKCFISESAYH